jgi:hypothetical protein
MAVTPPPPPTAGIGAASYIELVPSGFGTPTSYWVLMGIGTFTANGASAVTVADAAVTANSIIIPTLTTVGGTVGALPAIKTITPGTGFTIAATASDTSVYAYLRIG